MDKRFDEIRRLFQGELPGKTPIERVLQRLREVVEGDVYLEFARVCAGCVRDVAPGVDSESVSVVNVIRKMVMVVIVWGVYPHLPKSLHIGFDEDEANWWESPAPPRLLRPPQEMLDAIEVVLQSPGCIQLHPEFLRHGICVFYYLEKEKVAEILEIQTTETIVASLISLIAQKVNVVSMLSAVVRNRSDSLEALQLTQFPPKLCARAIAAPPSFETEDEYYDELFPKLVAAINSKKGAVLAKHVIGFIVARRPEQFLKHFDMDTLLNWPNARSVGPVLWNLNNTVFESDLSKVLINPLPQRIVFIAAATVGEVYDQAVKLIQTYMRELTQTVSLVKSVVEVASLCPLGLDGFRVVSGDDGVFIFANDTDEDDEEESGVLKEMSILEQMRVVLAECMDIQYTSDICSILPASLGGFHFLSRLLSRFTELSEDVGAAVLSYVAKLDQFTDVAVEIAKNVLEMCPKLTHVSPRVLDSFLGEHLPELCLLQSTDAEAKPESSAFDKDELLRDLKSPIIPLRGRGLYTLRKGIMTKDHPLRNEDMIKSLYPVIEKQLEHKDSYVYINAIQCLETIAIVYPHLVVDTLAAQFPQKNVEITLKIGQVLMLCARRNGPGLVHSPDGNLCGVFIKAFGRGCEHESDLVQASSLSNMATFVETLKFGVAPWFADIVVTMDRKWQIHNPDQVRRAASYLAYKVVQALGSGFEEFSKADLMILIEAVKRMRAGEIDEVAHRNAEDCYQTLWDICPMLL